MTAKEELIAKIKNLPEGVSVAGIEEEVALAGQEAEVLAAIEEGQADLAAGRSKTQEQVQALLNSWIAEWKK